MKQNSLQYLLDRFREGTLTDEERTELERLTHRDEVMSTAHSQARGIVRRRVSLAVGAMVVLGAGVMAVVPRPAEEVMIAEAREVAPAVQAVPEVEEILRPAEVREPMPTSVAKTMPVAKKTVSRPETVKPVVGKQKESVVVCNSQCDADAVIDDIKRFLSV